MDVAEPHISFGGIVLIVLVGEKGIKIKEPEQNVAVKPVGYSS